MNGSANRSFAETNKDFRDSFDRFMSFVSNTDEMSQISSFSIKEHFLNFIRLNVSGGKCIRGTIVVHFYRMLTDEKKESFTPFVVGWCVEMLQCVFLVLDDIMDNAKTRRGVTCWYLQERVGMMAINDAFMLENYIYQILKSVLSHEQYLVISEEFKKTSYLTSLGQSYDMHACEAAKREPKNFSSFTEEYYLDLVKYKTSYYTLILPFICGVTLTNFDYKNHKNECEEFLFDLGFLFQAQDDYFDCFADPNILGKNGCDIYEAKCTFLAVNLLNRDISQNDLLIFQQNYGVDDSSAEKRIKDLYKKHQLEHFFDQFMQASFEKLIRKSESILKKTKIETESLLTFVLNRKK